MHISRDSVHAARAHSIYHSAAGTAAGAAACTAACKAPAPANQAYSRRQHTCCSTAVAAALHAAMTEQARVGQPGRQPASQTDGQLDRHKSWMLVL